MAYEIPGFTFTLAAGADLSAKQYTAVKVNSSSAAINAANAEDCVGVVQNKPTSGQATTIVSNGISLMLAGTGGLTAGGNVGIDANGAAVAAASSDAIIGIALETISAAEYGAVLLRPAAKLAA